MESQVTEEGRIPELLLPPKPEEPLDSECCGTGCTPCVFDIYKEKLKRWHIDCENLGNREIGDSDADAATHKIDDNDIISPYEYRNYVVKEIIKDCEFCKIISFMRADKVTNYYGKKFPVKIGQHVVFKIEGKSRQYTVFDVDKNGIFKIIFKIYKTGFLTPAIDKLMVGSEVEMRGPFGKEFLYSPKMHNNLIMFAAGTGVAPFCRIIDNILCNENDETRILLLYACRSENEVLILYKMKEWSRSWNFKVYYFLSNAQDAKKAQRLHYGANITCGKIDKSVIENLKEIKLENNLYLICGTKSFDKDVLNYLKSVGVNEKEIKLF